MAKKSSLFKTLSTIIVLTTLTLSVATGAVIGRAVKNFTNAQQQQGKETRDVEKIEKTDNYGLIDEYTITYTDGTTSTFIVAGGNGDYGVNTFPSSDGYIPDVKIGDNGNFIVDGIDTGIAVQEINTQDPRSIVSIDKTDTSGLIDTYTITYTDGTTSTFLVVNGAEGPQGIQGLPGENGVTPTVSINDEGYWVINGQVTTFKAEGKDGTSLITGHGQPGPNEGKTGDTYFDVDSGNIYIKNETGWGQPIGNNQGASVLVGNGEPTPAEGKVGDSYIDASTGNIYIKNENGWSQPIGNNQGSSFLTGAGAPDNSQGKVGDSYLDTSTGLIYTKGENGWGTSIGSMMGPQGPQGQAGNGLLTGSGEPNPNLGNDNDSYVDTSTWNYYVKENGAWVLKGNLAGANGTTPHIGANGNWWIGNTDTGVAANGNSGTSVTTGHGNPNGDNSDPNNPIAAKEGNVGDTYVDLDTGTVYVKDENGWQIDPNGAAGIHGTTPHIGDNGNWWIGDTDTGVSATGPQGQQGQAGASVYTGTSAPSQGLGSNNDSYIDTATWNFYVKENGEWVLKGNLKGSQGQDGESISVVSCVKTGENGLVATYTITFSNGNTATFEVVNGAAGSAGAAGANGADGHTPVITIGANGNWFVDGTDTGVSATGIQGQAGEDGNGISGIIITNATATETTYRITFTDGSHFDYTVANGINGQDGADGTCMRTGETDPTNDLGRDGDSYINTVTWDYFVKEAGAWVFKGNIRGASGAAGAQGAAGQNGVSVSSVSKTGSNGLVDTYTITYSDGSSTTFEVTNGAAGTQGAAGQNGNTILVGIGAPTGATGGVDGDSYIDTATWNYYLKVSGNWELQGNIKGAAGNDGRGIASIVKTGPAADGLTYTYTVNYSDGSEPFVFNVTNGKNGTAVLTGDTNPTDQGVDGDSYINTTSWDYFVKENGSWVKKGNIKGVSIVSVIRTDGDGSAGTVDTYTITYSNGTTSTFTVTNGANGTNGKTLLTGTGAPNSAEGTVGDSYIDVASWTLYVKTAEDTWTSKGSFNGADGTSVTITDISTSGTGEPGTVDTYTVTFSDGNSLAITVYNGTNGKSLLTGAIDPTTEGVDGDSYINTSTWEYFIKESGVWTSKGIIKGNDGTSVTTGAGAPDNNDGIDGDSYIDLTTWTFYVKESGTWVEHGNIHNELDKYAVSFNLSYDSDSDGIDDTYTTLADVEHGHNINTNKPADPTRDGWIFQGWYTASGTKWDFEKDVVTGNIVLYAHWAKFKVVNGVLVECTATGDVVVPEFFDGQLITGIGDNVFKDNTGITSITIPYTVTSIGNSAFEGCTGLTSIIIPHNVKTIGNDAFKGCSNMAYVYIETTNMTVSSLRNPNRQTISGLESIGSGAFEGCSSLKNIVLPDSVKSIGKGAFKDCDALESYTAPFIGGTSNPIIKSITFSSGHGDPNTVNPASTVYLDLDTGNIYINPADSWEYFTDLPPQALGQGAPADPAPDNGVYLDYDTGTLYMSDNNGNWDSMDFTTFPQLVTEFNSHAGGDTCIGYIFGGDDYNDNDLYVPSSLVTVVITGDYAIASYALKDCDNILAIVITGEPTSIGFGAFEDCDALKTITLPYIGGDKDSAGSAFSVTFSSGHGDPNTVNPATNTYLDLDTMIYYANPTGSSWQVVNDYSAIGLSYGDGAPTGSTSTAAPYVDATNGDIYIFSSTWANAGNFISEALPLFSTSGPTGDIHFFGYIFGADEPDGQDSDIPNSLEKVILTGVNGANRDTIPTGAFEDCEDFEIVFPTTLRIINENAFYNAEFDSLVIPDSVVQIAMNAFMSADIHTLTIPFVGGNPDSVNTVEGTMAYIFGSSGADITKVYITGGNGANRDTIPLGAFTSFNHLNEVVIGEGIKTIGDDAFHFCTNLTTVILPSTIKTLGETAFFQTRVVNLVLPYGLETIKAGALADTYCTSFVIPGTVKTIGDRAFYSSRHLTTVVFQDGAAKTIGSEIFYNCSALESVYLGAGFTSVNNQMFKDLASLKIVSLSETITSIGDLAFQGCSSLKYIYLPANLESIGIQAFYKCSALENIVIPDSVSSIGRLAFAQCSSLKTASLSNNLTLIDNYVFQECTSLKAIVIPDSVTIINQYAFVGCAALTYVVLPEGLETIQEFAFAGCSSLESIVFPNSLENVGKGIFSGGWFKGTNLKDLYSADAPSINVCEYADRPTTGAVGDLLVCTNTTGNYAGAIYKRITAGDRWSLVGNIGTAFIYGDTDPTDPTAYPVFTLFINSTTGDMLTNYPLSNLKSISLPFTGGSSTGYGDILTGVLPVNGTPDSSLGNDNDIFVDTVNSKIWRKIEGVWISQFVLARSDNHQLGTIKTGDGDPVGVWGSEDFYLDLTSGQYYELNHADPSTYHFVAAVQDYLTRFGYIFVSPNGMYQISQFNELIPASLKTVIVTKGTDDGYGRYYIPFETFCGASNIVSVALSANIDCLEEYCFDSCTSLKNVSFGEDSNVSEILWGAFLDCTSLESIVIPKSVIAIYANAFDGCTSLKYVLFEEQSSLQTIQDLCFAGCTSLEMISIPNSVKKVYEGAFLGCDNLKSLSLPRLEVITCSGSPHVLQSLAYGNPSEDPTIADFVFFNYGSGDVFYNIDGHWELVYNVKPSASSTLYVAYNESQFNDSIGSDGDVLYKAYYDFNDMYHYRGYYIKTGGTWEFHRFYGSYTLGTLFGDAHDNADVPTSLKSVVFTDDNSEALYIYAFKGCSSLETVILPNGIDYIGTHAFDGCTNLKSINMPTGLTQIGDYAFKGCENITALVIPDTVTAIGLGAFEGWDSLENIVLPFTGRDYAPEDPYADPTHFGYIFGAVDYDSNDAYVPASLKTVVLTKGTFDDYSSSHLLAFNTFNGCSHIKSVSIPDSIEVILSAAFKDCSSLTNVTFGDNPTVELFGDYVFSGCSSLETFVVPKSVRAFYTYTFENCTSLKYVAFADGSVFTGMNEGAFAGCSNLTAISLPDTTEFIGPYAFKNCTSLETVVIPSSVTDIYDAIFIGCTSLKTVSVPYLPFTPSYRSETIDRDPDSTDDDLDDNWIWINTDTGDVWYRVGGDWYKSFNIKKNPSDTIKATPSGSSAPSNPNEGDIWVRRGFYNDEFLYSRYTSGNWTDPIRLNIRFLGSLFEEYVTDNSDVPDSLKTVIISNGERANYTFSFAECYSLETVVLPDDTEIIGAHAFEMCENLKNVNIPDSIIEIGEYAFCDCGLLKYVTFPYYILRIGDGAFEQCKSLIDADMSTCYDLFSIGEDAFADCSSLLRVNLPTELRTIGAYAFLNCDRIQDIYIPYDVERVGEYAFAGCVSLRKVVLYPNTTYTVIEESTFEGCTNLREVYFLYNSSIEEIGRRAFADCINLTCISVSGNYDFEATISLPTSLTTIGEQAFINCKGISAVVIPENVTEIGDKTFSYCTSLTYFMFNNRISSQPLTIGEQAFMDCAVLRSIVIPETTTSIGRGAFNHCYSLESMTAPALYEYAFYEYLDSYNSFNAINEWSSLKYVVLTGDNIVTSDGYDGAFQGFASLVSIEFRGTLRNNTIDAHAFIGCTNLKSVIVPDTMEYIEGEAFKNCSSLESFNVPASALFIGNNSFEGCSSLKYVYFAPSNGALSIGERAFKNCSSLESIAFPDTYSSLDLSEAIFEGCTSLKTLTLYDMDDFNCKPENPRVSDVDPVGVGYADYYASWLNYTTGDVFYVLNGQWELAFNIKPYSTSTILINPDQSNLDAANDGDVWLASATSYTYKIKVNGSWSKSLSIEHSSLGYLFDVSCENSDVPESLKTVVVNVNTNETYSYTFADCEYLETVVLPTGSVIIGDFAFSGCHRLKTANPPVGLALIGKSAFYETLSLETLYATDVGIICEDAFSWSGIRTLLISDGEIREHAFMDCDFLTDVMLINVSKIGDGAFYGCETLKMISLATTSSADINLYIGDSAFQECSSLSVFKMTSFVIIKSIGVQAFMDCKALASIDLSKMDCSTISQNAFRNCTSLNSITLNNSVQTIGNGAFEGCTSLTYVEMGTGVNTIGSFAFDNCISLTTINIKSTQMMTIDSNKAFNNCYSLNKVIYAGNHSLWTANFYDQLGTFGNKDWFSGVTIKCSDETFVQA